MPSTGPCAPSQPVDYLHMVSDTANATVSTASIASGEMMKKVGGDPERGPHLFNTAADMSGEVKKKLLASAPISCTSGSHSAGHSSQGVEIES